MRNPFVFTEIKNGKPKLLILWKCACGDYVPTDNWNFMTKQCEQCYADMIQDQEFKWGERPENQIDQSEYQYGDR